MSLSARRPILVGERRTACDWLSQTKSSYRAWCRRTLDLRQDGGVLRAPLSDSMSIMCASTAKSARILFRQSGDLKGYAGGAIAIMLNGVVAQYDQIRLSGFPRRGAESLKCSKSDVLENVILPVEYGTPSIPTDCSASMTQSLTGFYRLEMTARGACKRCRFHQSFGRFQIDRSRAHATCGVTHVDIFREAVCTAAELHLGRSPK